MDGHLNKIMKDIHATCVQYGAREDGTVDYVSGANIAGFVKVADAILDQGSCNPKFICAVFNCRSCIQQFCLAFFEP